MNKNEALNVKKSDFGYRDYSGLLEIFENSVFTRSQCREQSRSNKRHSSSKTILGEDLEGRNQCVVIEKFYCSYLWEKSFITSLFGFSAYPENNTGKSQRSFNSNGHSKENNCGLRLC